MTVYNEQKPLPPPPKTLRLATTPGLPQNLSEAQREIVKLRRRLKERDWVIAELMAHQFNKMKGWLRMRPVIDGEIVPEGVESPSVPVGGFAFIDSRTGSIIGGDDTPTEDETG